MNIVGVVLCGGKSTRFGSDKTWHQLDNKPLVQHCVDALEPQVGDLWLSCRKQDKRLAALGVPLIIDLPGYSGPLGALASSLKQFTGNFDAVLSLPVDTWPVPADLVAKLVASMRADSQLKVTIAASDQKDQYTLGLWRVELLSIALDCLDTGSRSMRALLDQTAWQSVDCGAFGNINTPNDLNYLQPPNSTQL